MTLKEGSTSLPGLTPEQLVWHEIPESKEYYAILSMFIEMWWVWWKAKSTFEVGFDPNLFPLIIRSPNEILKPLFSLREVLKGRMRVNATQFVQFLDQLGADSKNSSVKPSIELQQIIQSCRARLKILARKSNGSMKTAQEPLDYALAAGLGTAFSIMHASVGVVAVDRFIAFQTLVSSMDLHYLAELQTQLSKALQTLNVEETFSFQISKEQKEAWGIGKALPCPAGSRVPVEFKKAIDQWSIFLGLSPSQHTERSPLQECARWYLKHVIHDLIPWYSSLSPEEQDNLTPLEHVRIQRWIFQLNSKKMEHIESGDL